jgi:hypothetical protein
VANLITLLRNHPQSAPELSVSPQAIDGDSRQFEPRADPNYAVSDEEMDDPLLDLLRLGTKMQQAEFLQALERQRSGESVNA